MSLLRGRAQGQGAEDGGQGVGEGIAHLKSAKLGFGISACSGERRTFVVLDFARKRRNRFLIAKLVGSVLLAGAAGPLGL
jgi:hypothetical protein